MDNLFRDGLTDDIFIFDGAFIGSILHNIGGTGPDFTTGVMTASVKEYTIEGCIFRNSAIRDSTSQRQIGARDISITNDAFYMADKVVEVPFKDKDCADIEVREGDTFVDEADKKWHITAIDKCTLDTRFRLALKAFA